MNRSPEWEAGGRLTSALGGGSEEVNGSADEDRIKALEAENARLLDLVQKEPATAYLEAVQRACDERLAHLKHAERNARARADEAERRIAGLESQLAGLRTKANCLLGALIIISRMVDSEKIREFAARHVREATEGEKQ